MSDREARQLTPPSARRSAFQRAVAWIAHRLPGNRLLSLGLRFTVVYRLGLWSSSRRANPKSGVGSTVEGTAHLRKSLSQAAKDLFGAQETLTIVDAPCGDMTWMPLLINELATTFARVDYIGVDIVPDIVRANQQTTAFSQNVQWRFECADATRQPLPAADLLLCKDLVNHLSDRDVGRLLDNIQRSKCRYVMITSNKGWANADLPTSGFGATRHVDLLAPPFALPPPLREDGYLAFWALPWTPFSPPGP